MDCPTLRTVPKGAVAAVTEATEELCRAVLHSRQGSQAEARAWKLLLLRERLLLHAPLRLETGGRRQPAEVDRIDLNRLVRERVGALLRGDWAELMTQARGISRRLSRSRERAPTSQRDESYLADEVIRKVKAGEYGRAAALLQSPGLAPQTAETARQLQDLLQPRAAPAVAPGRAAAAAGAGELFTRKQTVRALRSTPRGSSAALGGGRWEHWRCLLGSPTAVTAFHQVLLRMASGQVPECIAATLALSKLSPLRKNDGGVRPIAAPSLLRRLAGRLLVSTRRQELAHALGPRQYAVGTSAGTELMAHTVRALLKANPQFVITVLDAKMHITQRTESNAC